MEGIGSIKRNALDILDAMNLGTRERREVVASILKYQGAHLSPSICNKVHTVAFTAFNALKACAGFSDWQKMVKKVSRYDVSDDRIVMKWSRYLCVGSAIQIAMDCQTGSIAKVPPKVVDLIRQTIGCQKMNRDIHFSQKEMQTMPSECIRFVSYVDLAIKSWSPSKESVI